VTGLEDIEPPVEYTVDAPITSPLAVPSSKYVMKVRADSGDEALQIARAHERWRDGVGTPTICVEEQPQGS
jgi:hypothetical protein